MYNNPAALTKANPGSLKKSFSLFFPPPNQFIVNRPVVGYDQEYDRKNQSQLRIYSL